MHSRGGVSGFIPSNYLERYTEEAGEEELQEEEEEQASGESSSGAEK